MGLSHTTDVRTGWTSRPDKSDEGCGPVTVDDGDDGDFRVREVLGERIEGGVVPPSREPNAAADSTGRIQGKDGGIGTDGAT